MRYQGSKARFKKIIKMIIDSNIDNHEWYVEPFVGGCNSFSIIDHNKKVGCDLNEYVIALWKEIKNGTFNPPSNVTKEMYDDIKNDYLTKGGKYSKSLIAYVGFCCSYGSGWWNGYAKFNHKKNENHIVEAKNGLLKQISEFKQLENCVFVNCDYKDLILTESCFIYCDPPYENTKKYANEFNNDEFWDWCREQVYCGHKVLVSEYDAPDDFICIWGKEMQDGMSKSNNKKTEKLFIHISQIPIFNFDNVWQKKKSI